VVRTVSGRTVPVAVGPFLARQEPVERVDEVVVRPGADLHDDQSGGGVRDEQVEQPVSRVRDEPGAVAGQVGQATPPAGPDRQLDRPQGKMLRSASRIRPSPPPAGVDS